MGIFSAKIRSRTSSISSSVITSSSRSELCHHLPGLREKTLCIQRCGACSTMVSASCKRYHLISPGFTPTGLLLQFTMYTISRAAFCCSRLHYELHLHSIAMSCTKSPSHNSVVPVANTVVVAATTVPTSASSASIAIAEGRALQKLLRQFLHLRQVLLLLLKRSILGMHSLELTYLQVVQASSIVEC